MSECTHHYACDCREAMMKAICDQMLLEHDEMAKFTAGFGAKVQCECPACKNIRELYDPS